MSDSGRVVDGLRTAILSGEYAAGESIRQEAIAKQFGASRLPVREALRTLEGEGLVTLEPNRGASVTALDAEELDLLYSTRARIEPVVLADSVPRLAESTIQRCGELLERIEAGVDPVEFLVLDRRFHLLSYEGCRSVQLRSIVDRLWNSTQHYRRAFALHSGPDLTEETRLEHRLLHRALATRNPEVAADIITTHITRTRVALRRTPGLFAPDTEGSGPLVTGSGPEDLVGDEPPDRDGRGRGR